LGSRVPEASSRLPVYAFVVQCSGRDTSNSHSVVREPEF
jgi:hypothetical protein